MVDETSNDDVTHVIDTSDDDTSMTDTDMDTNIDVTDVTTEKPFYQNLECEPLDETWMCSSGSKNHSLCIKFCTIGSDLSNFPVRWTCYMIQSRVKFCHVINCNANPKKMVHRNTKNVYANIKNALGLRKVKNVR